MSGNISSREARAGRPWRFAASGLDLEWSDFPHLAALPFMFALRHRLRAVCVLLCGLSCWLATEQNASAQELLAQTGAAKSILGWLLTLLGVALGLIVVCRPSGRTSPDAKEKKPRK